MKKIIHSKILFPFLIFLVVFFIGLSNYKSGTYLMGWDNLQTELNPVLAIKRAFFSSWQEYQSFGLVSGMAHAADLVRAIFLWAVSFLIPQSFVRYFFHLLMLYLGSLGLYYLLNYLGFSKRKNILAFFGAVFYILNLGTIQIFSLPYEPFSVFYAFLPWLILIFLKFIYQSRLNFKNIILLIIVNFLATPLAYLQTLFIVYVLCLIFLSLGIVLENKDEKKILIKRMVIGFVVIAIVNLFWIIPQMYFLKTSIGVVGHSKINQLATTIVSKQNMEKGTISNFARLEGFYYDLYDTSGTPIFKVWHDHYANFFTNIVSYLPFLFLILGIFTKRKNHFGFISILVLISLMLLSNTAVLSYFNSFIFSHNFINQIFRSPFTKFIIPFSLVFSYFFVCGLDFSIDLFFKFSKEKNIIETVILYFIIALILVIYSLPAYAGYFFSPLMRTRLPDSYLEVISYFKNIDENKRIALLPDYTFWGWYSTKWGYDGSGFLWYGLPQPVVSRTFDVWSNTSESYFWEIKYAIESANTELFEKTVSKYRIDYFILDKTLNPVSSIADGLQYDQIEKILNKSNKFEKVYTSDQLDVLKVNHNTQAENFVSLARNMISVSPLAGITNLDEAYLDLGLYKTYLNNVNNTDYYYPFSDLITQTNLYGKLWEIKEDRDYFVITRDLNNFDPSNFDFTYNPDTLKEASVFLGQNITKINFDVTAEVANNTLVIRVKKDLVQSFDPTYVDVGNCRESGKYDVQKRGANLTINSEDRGMACFGYESPLLAHWNGYLIKVDSENVKGNNLFFYIFGNKLRKQSKLETDLLGGTQYFILNPGYTLDDGYFFSFQNPSYQHMETQNILKKLDIYLFPFDYLKSIRFVRKDLPKDIQQQIFVLPNFDAQKINYYTYLIKNPKEDSMDVILYQSYDRGWAAYEVNNISRLTRLFPFIGGETIKNHVVINNWANGWDASQVKSNYIVLFYWPQILEYLGFVVLLVFIPTAYFISKR